MVAVVVVVDIVFFLDLDVTRQRSKTLKRRELEEKGFVWWWGNVGYI